MITTEKLFEKYIDELEKQCDSENKLKKNKKNIIWGDWNFYFFTKMGVKEYQVWCGAMQEFKQEFQDRLVPFNFLWDLGWFQRSSVFEQTGVEFCALALEQEKSANKMERWLDFDKLLFADVTHIRVFIGKASNHEFETLPKEYARYYSVSKCRKGKRKFLLILFNESLKGLRIGGWILNNNGSKKELGDRIFTYPGKA